MELKSVCVRSPVKASIGSGRFESWFESSKLQGLCRVGRPTKLVIVASFKASSQVCKQLQKTCFRQLRVFLLSSRKIFFNLKKKIEKNIVYTCRIHVPLLYKVLYLYRIILIDTMYTRLHEVVAHGPTALMPLASSSSLRKTDRTSIPSVSFCYR